MQRKWWHKQVAYQIYPKSFRDTTGNGIGDIRGITEKLDYIKDLGADIIWLSPCYCSPLADQGYDISDYYKIDPRFGSNEDLYELIREAEKRGIKILMDLVINHCSDEHAWFQEALRDPYGERAKYFFFEKAVDGHAPNNWRSYFGGSAWEKVPGTDLYYLHLFDRKQPDLNWENPKMRQEIYDMINWWLDRGVAGFRIDAIMNIKKTFPFAAWSFQPDRNDGLSTVSQMISKAEGLGDLLTDLKNHTFRPHDAFTVGEVFNEKPEDLPKIIGEEGYFSTMFDFNETIFGQNNKGWYSWQMITPEDYKKCVFETQSRVGDRALIATIIENHDEPRGVSHYLPEGEQTVEAKKLLGTLQFFARGIPFIYQGQEIGMENKPFVSIEEVDDVSSKDQYQVALQNGLTEAEALKVVSLYSRDNARTPMQWDDSENAGFTSGTPWLSVNPNKDVINVKAEAEDPDSVLSWYKKMIRLRKDAVYGDTIVYGTFESYLPDVPGLMSFFRRGEDHTLLIAANMQREEQDLTLPGEVKALLLNNGGALQIEGGRLHLQGWQVVVLEI